MVKIGFTGSRHGMNIEQFNEFKQIILSKEIEEFHHGMCVGADKQAHDFIKSEKIKIIGHPPVIKTLIADCECNIYMEEQDYLDRNKNIVDKTEILIATPNTEEKIRSGTWSTIRYARKKNKKIYIFYKNGTIKIE